MKSNYKRLGNYIREINIRNTDLGNIKLLGVSIQKVLIPSIANIIGTDMSTYKLIKKNQFAYGPVTSRNGDKISVAILEDYEEAMISQAYTSFEVIDKNELLPEYLMMWFRRPEFDRYARFMSHGSTREIFAWEQMCNTLLTVPSIAKQKEIVKEYNVLVDRISLNNRLIEKLEETAQTIYKQWFVDFEFPDENGKPYKSNGGEMEFNKELEKDIPKDWAIKKLDDICTITYGKTLPTERLMDEGYCVFGGNGIIGKYKEYTYEREQVIIACRGAASGKINVSHPKSYITNNSIVFENNIEKEFSYLKYYCLNNSFESYVTGSAQPQITIANIDSIKLLWPLDEIMDKYGKLIARIDKFHFNKEMENEKIINLTNLCLNKLVKAEGNL